MSYVAIYNFCPFHCVRFGTGDKSEFVPWQRPQLIVGISHHFEDSRPFIIRDIM